MLVLVGVLIVTGFITTASISFYLSRQSALNELIHNQLPLSSESIYAEMQKSLLMPETVAAFMANDPFLQAWAATEEHKTGKIIEYLRAVKRRFGAFTAFFVSDKSRTYYYADGILKQVDPDDPRDRWFFRVRDMQGESELNLDPDMAYGDQLTIFLNHRIVDGQGVFLGATGVGLDLDEISAKLASYQARYQNNVFLLTRDGELLLGDAGSFTGTRLRDVPELSFLAPELLNKDRGMFQYQIGDEQWLLDSRYIPELDLILCVEARAAKVTDALFLPLIYTVLICLIVMVVVILLIVRVIRHYQNELEKLAWFDPLTALLNRRAFSERYREMQSLHGRAGEPISLLMLDIDHFKQVNDRFGHHHGDQVLQRMAALLKSVLRPSDQLGRWGGEEFALLLPNTYQKEALDIADRIRVKVKEDALLTQLNQGTLSVSIGVAEQQDHLNIETHIRAADRGLYQAKEQGRDRVVCDA